MRTTLTLDEDIAAKLKEEMGRSGKPFKEIVNSYLRLGLNTPREARAVKPFVVRARDLKPRISVEYDNIGDLLELAEGPLHQ